MDIVMKVIVINKELWVRREAKVDAKNNFKFYFKRKNKF